MAGAKRTNHTPLMAGQNVFSSMAYSNEDVLQVGSDIKLDAFIKNPILLSDHYHGMPIGQVTSIQWSNAGLKAEFFFDQTIEEGRDSEHKWQRGLKSSLSVGLRGKQVKEGRGYTFDYYLREISQVTIPLDPNATAEVKQRMPLRVASLDEKVITASLKDAGIPENKEFDVILTASMAKADDLHPLYTFKPNREMAKKDKQASDDQAVDSVDPQVDSTPEPTPDYRSELIAELKSTKEGYESQITELKDQLKEASDQLSERDETVKTLQATIDQHEADAKKFTDDNAALATANQELRDKERDLEAREAKLKTVQDEMAVTKEAAAWRELLPEAFTATGKSIRQVLEAACAKGFDHSGISDDELRGRLSVERELRKQASDDQTAKHTVKIPSEYADDRVIKASALRELESLKHQSKS